MRKNSQATVLYVPRNCWFERSQLRSMSTGNAPLQGLDVPVGLLRMQVSLPRAEVVYYPRTLLLSPGLQQATTDSRTVRMVSVTTSLLLVVTALATAVCTSPASAFQPHVHPSVRRALRAQGTVNLTVSSEDSTEGVLASIQEPSLRLVVPRSPISSSVSKCVLRRVERRSTICSTRPGC